jgi:hypothetical protein
LAYVRAGYIQPTAEELQQLGMYSYDGEEGEEEEEEEGEEEEGEEF